MVCAVISGPQALENLNNNALSSWPSRTLPNNRVEPICRPGLSPSFLLQPGEAIFTTGSCFARNVEDALHAKGFNVVTRNLEGFGPEFFDLRRGLINNYGITSMFNDLSWALDPSDAFDETANFYPMGRNKFVDLHIASRIRPAPIEAVRERRRLMTSLAKRVVTASTVIMTLGLAEVWYDKDNDRFLNYAPPKTAVAKEPSRFELRILDYETAIGFIRRALILIRKTTEVPKKIVITVSPVPLIRTFTDQDVVTANCYSKSLLRVVAETITRENSDCDYYPSYESITLSNRRVAWNDDMVHVHDAIVAVNVKRMVDAYAPGGDEAASDVDVEEAPHLGDEDDEGQSAAPAAPDIEILFHDADRLAEAGRVEDAVALIKAAEIPAEDWSSRLRAAVALFAMRDAESAYQMLRTMVDTSLQGVKRVIAIRHLVPMAVATRRIDDAVGLCREWASIQSRSGQAYLAAAQIFQNEGRLTEAETFYRSALDAEPDSNAARANFASFLTKIGRHREGLRLLGRLPEEHAAIEALRTIDQAGEANEPFASSDEAMKQIAQDNETHLAAAELFTMEGHFSEAVETLKKVKPIPGDWKLKLQVATALVAAKDTESAYQMLKALLDDELVGMPRVIAYRVFVPTAVTTRRIEEAIEACRQWGAMHKGFNQGYLAGAQILAAEGRTVEAEAWYRHALDVDPESNAAKVQFSKFLSQIGKRREALRLLGHLEEEADPAFASEQTFRLQADHETQSEPGGSVTFAPSDEAAAAIAQDNETHFALAEHLTHSGRHTEAVEALKKVQLVLGDWKLKLKVATALVAGKDAESAYQLLKVLLDDELVGVARVVAYKVFVSTAVETRRIGDAIEACRQWGAMHKGIAHGYLAGAQILSTEGRTAEAEAWYRRALEVEPESHAAKVQFSKFLSQSGKRREALRLLGQLDEGQNTEWSGAPEFAGAEPRPDPVASAMEIEAAFRDATAHADAGRHQEAAARVRTLSIPPADWKSKLKAATLLLSAKDAEAAYRLVKPALDDDLIGTSRIFGLRVFTPIAVATGRVEEALDACRQLAALQTGQNQSVLAGAQILKAEGRAVEAEAWFRQALEIDPHSQTAKIQYSRFLNDMGRRRDALQLLGKTDDRRVAVMADPRPLAVKGASASGQTETSAAGSTEQEIDATFADAERLVAEGLWDDADVLIEGLTLASNDWKSKVRAAEIFLSTKNTGAAYSQLRDAIDSGLASVPRHVCLTRFVTVAASLGKTDEAIAACREMVPMKEGSNRSLLAGAQILQDAGRFAEAEAWYREALEVEPTSTTAKAALEVEPTSTTAKARLSRFLDRNRLMDAALQLGEVEENAMMAAGE